MDPISILTIAGSATTATYQVSKTIYEFINAVRDVDDTVHALSSELAGLRRSLDAIGTVLDNPIIRSEKACAPENAPIWSATASALEECRKSLSAIEKKIAPHQREKARHTLFKRAITTFKLNLSKDEIANMRSQVQTHTHSLQLSLQMINLLVSGLGPVNAVEEIGQEIAKLSATLEELDLAQSAGMSNGSLAQIKATAQDMLTKAPEFVSTGMLETVDVELRQKSIQALRNTVAEYNKAIHSSVARDAKPSELTSDDDSSDSDAEIEHTLTEDLFDKATSRFESRNYKEAEDYYRDGLRHHANLGKIGDSVDAGLARTRLAICCFQQEKFEEAELMFLIMTRSGDQVTPASLEAYHYLAQVYLCMYKFESALEFVSMAVKGRGKVFGKTDSRYFSSLKLQALIYEANGDFTTSRAYSQKVPADMEIDADARLVLSRFSGFSSEEHLRLSLKEKKEALIELAGADIIKRPAETSRLVTTSKLQIPTDFNPNQSVADSTEALHWAAKNGKVLLAKLLLARGAYANPSARMRKWGEVSTAAAAGNHEVLRLLLKSGADLEVMDSSETTPLYWATWWGHKNAVDVLLEHGANVHAICSDGDSAIHGAAYKGYLEIMKTLVSAGASLNARSPRTEKNALMQAEGQNQWEAVEYIVALGGEVNIHDWNGNTPLHAAVSERPPLSTVKMLLEAGADANASDREGAKPLHKCMRRGNAEIVRLLLQAGADPNGGDYKGATPLYRAVDAPDVESARLLLDAGALQNKMPDGWLLPGAVLKHNGGKQGLQILKNYPGFQDCRDRGRECRACSRLDKELGRG